ncbi:MAG: type II toxin-antitoxin system RelE/ParE family toxin [Patescibacteria group bacterium]|nr:type II toxin-antitoxin system RelE/ParE family toxin [Patescibacteria group bacterium]
MQYQIRFKPKAEKELAKLPQKNRIKINLTIAQLINNPLAGKKLQGEYANYYSLRVWPYRVIYTIIKKQLLIVVIYIGHRQGIYK